MTKMDPVVHFEMPAKDKKRTANFYSTVFGWNMTQMGENMGDYLLAGTTEVDEKMMPKTPGAINGGFFDFQNKEGYNMPHLVIAVDNLEASMEKVKKTGGKILGGAKGPNTIDDIPGIGRYISFEDTEGNHVGMLEPLPRT
ncbi:MAG: VOC family protein [Patescibacteria group bacterium]|nr:VOC family protein [Patescibacteria group bacterium]MDE2590212.1 VOC family protein [Patescibacteria group bacterium]